MTKIKFCTYSHQWQNEKRVMNKKAGDKKVYTCVVCLREHSDDGEDDKKTKK